MTDETHQFCKIFLCSPEPSAIMQALSELLGGVFLRRSMFLADATVDVLRNSDAGTSEDFVGWPTIVEIEATREATNVSIRNIAAEVLTAMWSCDVPAIASCSFEDELPWHGGMDRL
ncbi:hypothetical protein ACFYMW_21390 [Streptomyces sp. NPDC006692]|uniref:hypothetical protein n=1 Tax=Streptomyces sp. NPDC006692 TaxID=3364758 RepID=UPI0036A06B81